ncbi:hypothetical protein GUJ93_ZPchr0007g5520 [Zizania palustris]|uniref:Uncharacterized protein n=1 Tax=Zizania palustris TaxID=103762 RepID=A0A8J5TG96_ZIZPA|nr:hypothetical protein GUJ93_ZPchr0007g5520 [Zizania palustris]
MVVPQTPYVGANASSLHSDRTIADCTGYFLANLGLSRDEFRQVRGCIVEMLCKARDEEVAEELSLVLDNVMVESLARDTVKGGAQ